ncbi:hypothetical protein [Streptomyces sp. A012304]|nr:hypothetical protein [Streptomyces sp. A012304]
MWYVAVVEDETMAGLPNPARLHRDRLFLALPVFVAAATMSR